MTAKWGFFAAACFFTAWLLVSNGAPLGPVLAGVGGVAAWRLVAALRSGSAVRARRNSR